MQLLIDTWNVLHQVGILPPESAGMEVTDLYNMLQKSRFSRHQVTFVCDGTPTQTAPAGTQVKTIFTGIHRTADEEIISIVSASSAARSILVVTSDREIIKKIKTEGAQHAGSAEFLKIIVEDQRLPERTRTDKPTHLSQKGALAWKELFGVDDQMLEELQEIQLPDHLSNKDAPSSKPTLSNAKKSGKSRKAVDTPSLPPELVDEARRILGL